MFMMPATNQDSQMKAQHRKEYRTSVILTEEQHQQLNAVALRHDASIAWVIRQAVMRMLQENPNENSPIKPPAKTRKRG